MRGGAKKRRGGIILWQVGVANSFVGMAGRAGRVILSAWPADSAESFCRHGRQSRQSQSVGMAGRVILSAESAWLLGWIDNREQWSFQRWKSAFGIIRGM